MSFTGTRIENGMIAWNEKKPKAVTWPIAGNVSGTVKSTQRNAFSRATPGALGPAAMAAARNYIAQERAVTNKIGYRYGQGPIFFRGGKKTRKVRKTRRHTRRRV